MDIDPSSGVLRGVTELTFDLPEIPTLPPPTHLQLHLRQATVHEIYCNDTLVPSFSYTDPYAQIRPRIPSTATFAQRMADLRKQHQDCLISSYNPDMGELSIPLPDLVLNDLFGEKANSSDAASEEAETPSSMALGKEGESVANSQGEPTDKRSSDGHDQHNVIKVVEGGNEDKREILSYSLGDSKMEDVGNRSKGLQIRVLFSLDNPQEGLYFLSQQPPLVWRYPQVYTGGMGIPGIVRFWLPCVDELHARCTWELEFIVPRYLQGPDAESRETQVVCSGDCVDEFLLEEDQVDLVSPEERKVVRYTVNTETSALGIVFAIGPWSPVSLIPGSAQSSELGHWDKDLPLPKNIALTHLMGYAPKERLHELVNTCQLESQVLDQYIVDLGGFPYPAYRIVFIKESIDVAIHGAGVTLLSENLLYPSSVMEQGFETQRILDLALATQWFGQYILPRNWSDMWLILGIAGHVSMQSMRQWWGGNETLFRLQKDIHRCCDLDVERDPLCEPTLRHPPYPETQEFMRVKAPLVLYMLDQKLVREITSVAGSASATISSLLMVEGAKVQEGKGNGQATISLAANVGLSRVRKSILLAALSGELDGGLGTGWFLRACKRLSSATTGSLDASGAEKSGGIRNLLDRGGMGSEELRAFASQWIFGRGCPVIRVDWAFNRKRMVVELRVLQTNTTTDWYESLSDDANSTVAASNNSSDDKGTEGGKETHGSTGSKKPKAPKTSNLPGSGDVDVTKNREVPEETQFPGPFIVRIREADGVTYEHELLLSGKTEEWQRFDVPFNTKYKRVRKGLGGGVGGSRWTGLVTSVLRREGSGSIDAASMAGGIGMENAENYDEDGEGEGDGPSGEGSDVYGQRGREAWDTDEKDILGGEEEARRKWAAVEWSEEAEASQPSQPMTASAAAAAAALTNASGNFEWLRVDADGSWLGRVRLRQEPPMWAAQLAGEGDVVAQLGAVRALALSPSPAASTSLLRAALEPRYHPGVRSEAVVAMARCRQGAYQRLSNLLCAGGWGRACRIEEGGTKEEGGGEEWMLLDGGLRGGADGRVGRSVIRALGLVRGEERRRCIRLLLSLLRYYGVDEPQDGQGNAWAVCTLIAALGAAYCQDIRPDPHGGMDRRNWFQGGGWLGWTPPPVRRIAEEEEEEDDEGHGHKNQLKDEEEMVFQEAMREVDRWMVREMERQRTRSGTSYRGMILATCIRTIWQWMAARRLPLRWEPLVRWAEWSHGSGEDTYEADREVRCAALEGLLVLGIWREEPPIRSWLLSLVLSDPDRGIRRWLAKRWVQVVSSGRSQRSHGSDGKNVFGGDDREEEVSRDGTIRQMMLEAFGGLEENDDEGDDDDEDENDKDNKDNNHDGMDEQDEEHNAPKDQVVIKLEITGEEGPSTDHKDGESAFDQIGQAQDLESGSPHGTSSDDTSSTVKSEEVDFTEMKPNEEKIPEKGPGHVKGADEITSSSSFPGIPISMSSQIRSDLLQDPVLAEQVILLGSILWSYEQLERMVAVEVNPEEGPAGVLEEEEKERDKARQGEGGKIRLKVGGMLGSGPSEPLSTPQTHSGAMRWVNEDGEEEEMVDVDDEGDTSGYYGAGLTSALKARASALPKSPRRKRKAETRSKDMPEGLPLEEKTKRKRQRTARDMDHRLCRQWLKRIETHRSAFLFLHPVDPVAHGAPDYHQVIKKPMDLGTIRAKLDAQDELASKGEEGDEERKGEDVKYGSREMWDDVRSILDNCYTYNPAGSYAYTQAQELETVVKRGWKKVFGSLPGEEKGPGGSDLAEEERKSQQEEEVSKVEDTITPVRDLEADASHPIQLDAKAVGIKEELSNVLDILKAHPSARAFLIPVDPDALGVPTYRDIIRHPMDLGTMQAHLDSGTGTSDRPAYDEGADGVRAFQADFRRIISNCRLFNGPDDWIVKEAKTLEGVYHRAWSKSSLLTSLSSEEEGGESTVDASLESGASIAQGQVVTLAPETPVPTGPSKIRLKLTGLNVAKKSPATKAPSRPVIPPIQQKKVRFTGDKASAILLQLLSSPSAPLFRLPVDWQGMGLTDYPDKVKEPMDLSTIQSHIDQNFYQKVGESKVKEIVGSEERMAEETDTLKEAAAWEAFRQDLVRIFRAAFTYNARGTFASQQATKLKGEAERALDKAGITSFVHAAALEVQKSRGLPAGSKEVWTPKVGRKILRKLKSLHPHSAPFVNPVDWKRLRIPHYLEMIKEPMDLGTVGQRVDEAMYEVSSLLDTVVREAETDEESKALAEGGMQSWMLTRDESSWARDTLLIFGNCYQFNGPDSEVSQQAKILERAFWAELRRFKESSDPGPDGKKRPGKNQKAGSEKAGSRKRQRNRRDEAEEEDGGEEEAEEAKSGPGKEKGGWYAKARTIWKMLSGIPEASPFLYAVDAEALNIPDYYAKVTKPMDLASIRKKLDRTSYKDPQGFIQDIRQIRLNTELYNGADHPVSQMAQAMESIFDQAVQDQSLNE
ncbi:hypothetical protein BJ684DRAFT_19130 [Piptocephalis cylindrospora]|uniref:Transcription initiation factor TFIID subunit 2 n=1 Tax=Piptocephalis cylindrospora TaxID=1907219 RepID=A0A4P9Y5Y7_9FUNG|nr:hypothetical protein BJ684DRAFT_19130 [Piptocephalis cylindrospora]|eukprot:RKP14468.1 hypothetical protein BJ684DRAFT_19130 [Piptocephalis cylindrospora]